MPKKIVTVGGKQKVVHLPYPSAKAGNYRAPVDTVGMDPEMKETLGVGKKKPAPGKKRGK